MSPMRRCVLAFALLIVADASAQDIMSDAPVVPNLAEGRTITTHNSFVSKTSGVLSRADSIRITTLEFEGDQVVAGCTFRRIALGFDSDKPAQIAYDARLRERLDMRTPSSKLFCAEQFLAMHGRDTTPILLYAPDTEEAAGRFANSLLQAETQGSGFITLDLSQGEALELPLLKFRIGETLIRCVLYEPDMSVNPASPSTQATTALEPFEGRWIHNGNKERYVVVSRQGIRWKRGDREETRIPQWMCKDVPEKKVVSFPVPSNAAMCIDGKIIRAVQTAELSLSGTNSLTIVEGRSHELKHESGFAAVDPGGATHTFSRDVHTGK